MTVVKFGDLEVGQTFMYGDNDEDIYTKVEFCFKYYKPTNAIGLTGKNRYIEVDDDSEVETVEMLMERISKKARKAARSGKS